MTRARRIVVGLTLAALVLLLPRVGWAQAGVEPGLYIQSDGILRGVVFAPVSTSCTAGLIGYSFNLDTDTGVARTAANTLVLCAGGGAQATITSAGLFTLAGPIQLPDGTAAAPSMTFTTDTDTGIFHTTTGDMPALVSAGTVIAGWRSSGEGLILKSDQPLSWSSGTPGSAGPDTILAREAAGHLFQRNSTNAQRASWANTYTGAASYEAVSVDWQTTANTATIGTRTAATGTGRAALFVSQASSAGDDYAAFKMDRNGSPMFRMGIFNTAMSIRDSALASFLTLGEYRNISSSGPVAIVSIIPTYNQTSTAAGTDFLINRTETAVGSGAQNLLDMQIGSTSRYRITAGGATGRGTQVITTQAVAPTCTSNCGTSPSVAGSDSNGRVTMGSSGVPASGWVVTFNGTWPNAPQCQVWASKTGMVTGKKPIVVVTATTTFTVTTDGTAPATSDTYDYMCFGN